MKICCYCRVSSQGQADANSTDSQRAVMEQWIKARGAAEIETPPVWFQDLALSGKSMKRPEWEAMNARVLAGEFDTVLVYDLSRAGRTLKGLLIWVGDMVDRKVRVVFVKEGFDLDKAVGRFIFNIMGAVVEYTREMIVDRVRDGVSEGIRKRGGKWGGSLGQHGSKGGPKLTPDQDAEIRARLDAGESAYKLAKEYKVQYRTIKKRNPRGKAQEPLRK